MGLFIKNLLFTIVVGGYLPWWLFGSDDPLRNGIVAVTTGGTFILVGISLYIACIWPFATVGRGTPAPIDAPVHLATAGPYAM